MSKPTITTYYQQGLEDGRKQATEDTERQIAVLREALGRCRNDLLAYGKHLSDPNKRVCTCGQMDAIKAASAVLASTTQAGQKEPDRG